MISIRGMLTSPLDCLTGAFGVAPVAETPFADPPFVDTPLGAETRAFTAASCDGAGATRFAAKETALLCET